MKKKCLFWCLVFVWMVVIFVLSSQTGRQSSRFSYDVSDTIIDSSVKVKEGIKTVVKSTNTIVVKSADSVEKTVNAKKDYQVRRRFNSRVRSIAHSINYCILAILLFFALKQHGLKSWNVVLLTVLICILYALSDEFHQSFVPGRGCEFKDGVYDFVGSLIGVAVAMCTDCLWTVLNIDRNKSDKKI